MSQQQLYTSVIVIGAGNSALAALPDLILEGQLKLTTYGLNFNRFKPEKVIVNAAKYQIAQALKESGLEYVQVHVGVFAHYASLMLFKFNKETNTVHYNGNLNEKVDISFLEDVGKFVAAASIRKDIVGDIDVKSDTLTVRQLAQIIHGENVQFKQDQTIESWLDSIQKGIAEKSNSPQELFPILLEQLVWAFFKNQVEQDHKFLGTIHSLKTFKHALSKLSINISLLSSELKIKV